MQSTKNFRNNPESCVYLPYQPQRTVRPSTRYTTAVHICVFLAHTDGDLVSSSTLAESVNTNPVVIRRLVHDLIEHNILSSVAGPKGGFRLQRPASNISLGAIYLATRENEFFRRPKPNPDCVISSNLKILVHDVFENAEEEMLEVLENTSIEDLDDHLVELLGADSANEAIRRGD